jgi:hypothetical protein
MNASCAFAIGKTHDVCQDYAVAGGLRLASEKGVGPAPLRDPYALVSDGCSSSSDTDIGARLLVKSAERLVQFLADFSEDELKSYHEAAVDRALAHAATLGLSAHSIDATLLSIKVCGGRFVAACYGDGVIAARARSGELTAYSITFAESYPRYPSYSADAERQRIFVARTGNLKEVTTYRWDPSGVLLMRESTTSTREVEAVTGTADAFAFVSVLSDGIHSFTAPAATATSRHRERVALEACIPGLLAFRAPTGAFVQRRLNRFLDECKAVGWQHHDDLAIASVYLGG